MAKHASSKPLNSVPSSTDLESLWSRHNALWRDTAQITSQWHDAQAIEPQLLDQKVRGAFWDVLGELEITLLISREYEHLLFAMSGGHKNSTTFMPMPHPSGIAVDRKQGVVHVASTRNPNQIYDLMPVSSTNQRRDISFATPQNKPLVPVRSRFFPGCLYMHDLAMIDGELYANAVGQNAIVKFDQTGHYKHVWWPKCIESGGKPNLEQNYIQLNSIAAGKTLADSFFSASSCEISRRRPGHKNYPVDGRGVIFSARTREPIAYGLTRPHSARLVESAGRRRIFVDNSGYGTLEVIDGDRGEPVVRLPGWTRGLVVCRNIAFVGTSRVIPRFKQYAPGLDVEASVCGVHAIDLKTGKVLGSVTWPSGNQIFAIDWLPSRQSAGFPFSASAKLRQEKNNKALFYTFATGNHQQSGKTGKS